MKHLSSIIIKFLMITVILEIMLNWLTELSSMNILIISAVVTVLAYLIGDLFILSKTNNTVATISDIVLSLIVILIFNYAPNFNQIEFTDAIICAVVIGVGEWFFHKYVSRKVFPAKQT